MAAEKREPDPLETLREQLLATPPKTDFFTAVGLLERMTADHAAVGRAGPFHREAILFRHDPSFGFHPNDISKIEYTEVVSSAEERLRGKKFRYEVTTCFLGLSGADSPMPLYHVEKLVSYDDAAVRQAQFLDLFHNRLVGLMFRARIKYDYAREFLVEASDEVSLRTLALGGIDAYDRPADPALTNAELLRISALLAGGGSAGRSLEHALTEFMADALDGVGLVLAQFTGGWIGFDAAQRNTLGRANSSIAQDWVLGTKVLHPAHRARVTIGPMNPVHAREFSPGGREYKRIKELVATLSGEPIAYDLELLVREDAYPPFVLSARNGRILGEDVFISGKRAEGRILRRVFDLDKAQGAEVS